MTTDFSGNHLNKFDGTNFQAWKFQVKAILVANEIYKVVNGETAKPDDLTTADGKKWVKENAKGMYILSSAMLPAQLENYLTCETAKDMWDKMALIFEQKSATNKATLLQKFYTCQMSTSETVIQYVTKVLNMARGLRDLEETISDAGIIAKILGSLPEKYNAFVTSWDSVDIAKQTIDTLQERLIKEEQKLSEQEEKAGAFVASSNFRNKKYEEKPTPQTRSGEGQKPSTSYKCYVCGIHGHIARNCKRRKKFWKGKQHSNNDNRYNNKEVKNDQPTAAFISTMPCLLAERNTYGYRKDVMKSLHLGTDDAWITDSGASRHLTFLRDWFQSFSPCYGESVVLGDNEVCSIEGKGTIMVESLVDGVWRSISIENVHYVPRLKKN